MFDTTPTPQPSTTPITPLVMNDVLAAEYLGISAHTLRKWRSQGTGPAYVCVGRLKKYRLADLVVYAQNQLVCR
jgi:predicted site-specific integrase-resolvase